MLINFIDATNDANHYTKPPPKYYYYNNKNNVKQTTSVIITHVYTEESSFIGTGYRVLTSVLSLVRWSDVKPI